ncbi:MAG: hypothetical protein IPN42_19260 [Methylococcaceae bacterium]|nr:hypothetical protein [Methylococcaceae bacterium]
MGGVQYLNSGVMFAVKRCYCRVTACVSCIGWRIEPQTEMEGERGAVAGFVAASEICAGLVYRRRNVAAEGDNKRFDIKSPDEIGDAPTPLASVSISP